MSRTPLLLVFGEHPGFSDVRRMPGERRFFKKAINRFLSSRVERGERSVILHEFYMHLSKPESLDPKKAAEVADQTLKIHEGITASILDNSVNLGIRPQQNLWEALDWGFMDSVLKANADPFTQGLIRSVTEKHSLEAITAVWQLDEIMHTHNELTQLERAVWGIEMAVAVCHKRAEIFVSQVNALRDEDPSRAIVAPRGYAHQFIADRFDQNKFDVMIIVSDKCVPSFSTEAVIEAARSQSIRSIIERFARLQIHASHYGIEIGEPMSASFLRVLGFQQTALRLSQLAERRYAIAHLEGSAGPDNCYKEPILDAR